MKFEGMSDQQLKETYFKIQEDMAEIKGQIANAKATAVSSGVYADANWFAKANTALKHKQVTHQIIQREMSDRRKAKQKDNNRDLAVCFMDCAREVMDPEDFFDLLDRARDLSGSRE